MSTFHVVLNGGEVTDPITADQAVALVREGRAKATNFARSFDSDEWKPLGMLVEINATQAAQALDSVRMAQAKAPAPSPYNVTSPVKHRAEPASPPAPAAQARPKAPLTSQFLDLCAALLILGTIITCVVLLFGRQLIFAVAVLMAGWGQAFTMHAVARILTKVESLR